MTYYYRRVFTDAVRAVDASRGFAFVDPDAIAVTGGSQGGGIAIAAAALAPAPRAVLPDVPFLCAFRRGAEIAPGDPYGELATLPRRAPRPRSSGSSRPSRTSTA